MSFATNIQNAFTRVATEFRTIRSLITGTSTGDLTGLTTTTKASIVAAINEVNGKPTGGASTLDALDDAVVGSHAAGRVLRADGTNFVDVLGTDYFEVAGAVAAHILQDTALGGGAPSTTSAPSQASVKAYADALIGANDAMVFKGVIDCSTNPNYPAANRGDTYKVSVAGKIGGAAGPNVEVGDLVICTTDGTAAGTQATVGASWDIVQVNIDGAVTGPAASTSGDFVTFNGAGGKVIQDSGVSLDVDAALTANSDARIPSQKAVKGYTYSQAQIGDPTTDFVTAFVNALTA